MNAALIAAIFIAAAAALGAWRTWRDRSRHRAVRLVLQFAAALFLYLALFPPQTDERFDAGELVVLTPGVTERAAASASGALIVALPGAPGRSGAELVPDLGTALRRHPQTTRLRVLGGGLPPRDLDAARGIAVTFDASPLPKGIVDLSVASTVRAGSVWSVRGRVEGDAGGRIELRDPAGAVISQMNLAGDGTFVLSAKAKSPGNALFALGVRDAAGASIEELPLAIAVREGEGLRVLLLAGAPDPDLKYWRRWAVDAGIELGSRVALSDGIAMQDGSADLAKDALDKTDAVIIDERAWRALDADAKMRLTDAVRDGLGLLLRITGPLPDAVAQDWQALGFRIRPSDIAQTVALEIPSDRSEAAASLSRRALAVEADAAAPLLRAADGSALALWRNEGQGRVAVWWLADSYRLGLGGDAARFGTLWSNALATIARARGSAAPRLPADARVNQRSVFCGIEKGAAIEQADGARVALSIDESDPRRACAAYWPARAGWQTLISGEARWSFRVRGADEGKALAAAQTADATRALAGQSNIGSAAAIRRIPAPRWPFFLGWLAIAAALWWLERSERLLGSNSEP